MFGQAQEQLTFAIIAQEDQEDNYDILVEAIVNEVYVETYFKQLYKNISDHPIELRLNLELLNKMQFVDFEVEIEDKKIKSKLINKEKGEEKYTDSLSSGNTGIYVENDENNPNKYIINLGNIESNKTVFIKYHFIQTLKSNNLNYIYMLTDSFPYINNNCQPKSIKAKIKFETKFPIVNLESKVTQYNPKIKYKYNDDRTIEVEIMIKDKFTLSIFSYLYKKYKPLISFEFQTKNDEIPKLYKQYDSKNDETSFLFRNLNTYKEVNNLEKKGMYYILFNEKSCLNSDYYKTFLKTFLSLLPEGSYYQIIEFGTCLKLYNIKPLQYSSTNYEKIINKIKLFNSSMNYSIDMNEPFEYINTYGDNNNNIPTFILIVNDKYTLDNNASSIINKYENIKNKYKVYEYRFLEDSNNFISISSVENGETFTYNFIENENLKEMIKKQLNDMSSKLKFDISINNTNELLYYFKDENTYRFIMKGKVNGQIDINNNYIINNIYHKNKLSFNEENIVNLNDGDTLAKTIIHNIIQNEINDNDNDNDNDNENKIKLLSKKYKILCRYTSLFGIIENNENIQEGNMQLNDNYIINRNNQNSRGLSRNIVDNINNNQNIGGGLFGNTYRQNSGVGLFGTNNNQNTGGSLFGNTNRQNSGVGLFGYNNQNSGGLFSTNNNQNSGGGLFGNNYYDQSSRDLFYSNNSQNSGGVLFDNNYNNNTCGNSLFRNEQFNNNIETSSSLFNNNYNNTQTLVGLEENNKINTQTSDVNNQKDNEINIKYNNNLLKEVIKTMDNEGYWNENEYTTKILKMEETIYEKVKKLVNNDKIAITFIILYYILNEVKDETTEYSDIINKAKQYLTRNDNTYEEIKSKLGL